MKKGEWLGAAGFLAVTLGLPRGCFANGFKAMAEELLHGAGPAKVQRVAILPFVPADGSTPKDGWSISEKLMTQMVRLGRVQVVERFLLRNLMEEQRLARTGIIDPSMLKKIGKIFSVDAVVAGSFVTLGADVVVNARLVDVETGVVLAAVERQVDRGWFDALSSGLPDARSRSLWIPVSEITVAPPAFPREDLPGWRDAPTGEVSCEGVFERVDRMENQILDLKARYWALQLRKGASLASIKVNPGSTISDPDLKKSFYDRMRYWYGLENIPELTPAEVQRFVTIDGEAYSLSHRCDAS